MHLRGVDRPPRDRLDHTLKLARRARATGTKVDARRI